MAGGEGGWVLVASAAIAPSEVEREELTQDRRSTGVMMDMNERWGREKRKKGMKVVAIKADQFMIPGLVWQSRPVGDGEGSVVVLAGWERVLFTSPESGARRWGVVNRWDEKAARGDGRGARPCVSTADGRRVYIRPGLGAAPAHALANRNAPAPPDGEVANPARHRLPPSRHAPPLPSPSSPFARRPLPTSHDRPGKRSTGTLPM